MVSLAAVPSMLASPLAVPAIWMPRSSSAPKERIVPSANSKRSIDGLAVGLRLSNTSIAT
jgi:hypothetical protein